MTFWYFPASEFEVNAHDMKFDVRYSMQHNFVRSYLEKIVTSSVAHVSNTFTGIASTMRN